MRRISDHLSLATSTIISNTWLLEHEGKKWLVDAGHPLERPGLLLALWRAGVRKKGDLAGVLLTHRHSDHAGNARWLRDRFGCQVACHEDDARALRGDVAPPKMSNRGAFLVHELLCRIEDRFPARCPVDETWREGSWKHGFEVFHVPGHTEGSVMLYHEPTATLFSGDAILSGIPPIRLFEYLRLAVPEYSLDVAGCHAAIKKRLEALPRTETLCSGHGPAVRRGTHEKLLRLLARFAEAEGRGS